MSLFMCFPCYKVAEVLSRDKTRLSISGWFYGEPFHRPEPYVEPEPVSVSPLKVSARVLFQYHCAY